MGANGPEHRLPYINLLCFDTILLMVAASCHNGSLIISSVTVCSAHIICTWFICLLFPVVYPPSSWVNCQFILFVSYNSHPTPAYSWPCLFLDWDCAFQIDFFVSWFWPLPIFWWTGNKLNCSQVMQLGPSPCVYNQYTVVFVSS